MRDLSRLLEMLNLGRQCLLQQRALESSRGGLGEHGLVKPVQDPGHRGEEIGLDDLGVFEETEVVARAVGDDSAGSDREELEGALEAGRTRDLAHRGGNRGRY